MRFKLRVTVRIRTIGSGQDKPFGASLVCLAGFCVNRKEVFILLLRHLGRAGIGVNSSSTSSARAV